MDQVSKKVLSNLNRTLKTNDKIGPMTEEIRQKWKKRLEEGRPIKTPDWVDIDLVSQLLANQEVARKLNAQTT